MNRHRPVPGIAQQRQSFQPTMRPPIPSPIFGQAQQPTPQQAISEQMQQMAMEIYAELAADHIRFKEGGYDSETLRGVAKASQAAARAYFEALGVQFGENQA